MNALHRCTALMTAITLVGCASGGASSGGAASPRRNANVISAAEVAASSAPTAVALVRELRPGWLTQRGLRGTRGAGDPVVERGGEPTEGPAGVVVYRDGVRVGLFSSLETIMVETIQEVRWLDGPDATQRYGTGHGAGAIEVTTRR